MSKYDADKMEAFSFTEDSQVTKKAVEKKARKLLAQWHPDRNPEDENAQEMYKKIVNIRQYFYDLLEPPAQRVYQASSTREAPRHRKPRRKKQWEKNDWFHRHTSRQARDVNNTNMEQDEFEAFKKEFRDELVTNEGHPSLDMLRRNRDRLTSDQVNDLLMLRSKGASAYVNLIRRALGEGCPPKYGADWTRRPFRDWLLEQDMSSDKRFEQLKQVDAQGQTFFAKYIQKNKDEVLRQHLTKYFTETQLSQLESIDDIVLLEYIKTKKDIKPLIKFGAHLSAVQIKTILMAPVVNGESVLTHFMFHIGTVNLQRMQSRLPEEDKITIQKVLEEHAKAVIKDCSLQTMPRSNSFKSAMRHLQENPTVKIAVLVERVKCASFVEKDRLLKIVGPELLSALLVSGENQLDDDSKAFLVKHKEVLVQACEADLDRFGQDVKMRIEQRNSSFCDVIDERRNKGSTRKKDGEIRTKTAKRFIELTHKISSSRPATIQKGLKRAASADADSSSNRRRSARYNKASKPYCPTTPWT